MPIRSRTAMLGRTAVIGLYLIALLATPGPPAIAPAALLGAVWLAGYARDLRRAAGFARAAGPARDTGHAARLARNTRGAAGPARNTDPAGAGDGR
ncbi:hypothetical protein J2S43_001869 [Catenuloplanes nepalensis]|uniref:Uncharacterized protein n=1 Tax=Catenuloplanes nepalensis TaxID=587533 RepID=A0ABT9MPK0_9ACTN|nr:hypothetical protein [Catenuloplanes nepalensis]MDP9793357.1 hypothetical protein [Catenuloplanes nepalensis]